MSYLEKIVSLIHFYLFFMMKQVGLPSLRICCLICILYLKFNYRPMEMKINFDQLFGSAQQLNSTFELQSSDIDHSFQTSLNNSFQYKFSLNQPIFDQSASESEHIKLIDDEEFEEESRSVQTKKSTKTKQSSTSVRHSQPGQRLFYQSQETEMRKNKERERIEKEKVAELRSMPFAPTINKNSRKLAEKIKTQPREQIKPKQQAKTTMQLKEEEFLKQCTFQPKLIAKNAKGQTKSKQELFYYLHNTSKIKEMKMNRKAEQDMEASKVKKVSKQVFIEFLKRNEEYNNVIKKKHEIMKQKADNYDLKTGEKLFSPKISDNKFDHFFPKNSSSKNILISPKNAQYRSNPLKNQTQKKANQPQQEKPKLKSNIFAKKNRTDSYEYMQAPQDKESKIEKPSKNTQKEQEYYSEQYRQYSEQFDRRTAAIRQASISQHDIIPEQEEHSFHQAEKQGQNQVQNQADQGEVSRHQFFDYEGVEQEAQGWNSHEIRPFELSNVNQYLNASEQDEPQPRNNYVMDILNNLMSSKQEQE